MNDAGAADNGRFFFERRDDDVFVPSEWTIGPWDRKSQHAGPPAALIGRVAEAALARPDMQAARATFEILRPVPLEPLRITASVVRPGRSVALTGATLADEKGPVIEARLWFIRAAALELEPVVPSVEIPLPPGSGTEVDLFGSDDVDYLRAMEWRFVRGGFLEPGPATAWARMRVALVAGEQPSALTRVLTLADSGNGISASLDFSRWVFINPDLSVYLHRLPRGEWVCLDATTTIEASGIGLASSRLFDRDGMIGRGEQSLFVGPRHPS